MPDPKVISFNGEYRFLSNFHPCNVDFEGITYRTVEHAYQAAKTNVPVERAAIAASNTPGMAKEMGRSVALREDWDDVKLAIMETLLRKKFYDPTLRAALRMTGNTPLKELNYWHDQFWGSCTCIKHYDSGENHLGKLLMKLREELAV